MTPNETILKIAYQYALKAFQKDEVPVGAVIYHTKTKRTRYVNNGLCGCLCNECHHNHVDNQIDYTGDIAEQIISRHKDPNDPQANDDGWETLPYNSYCIYFFNKIWIWCF